jgi:hypothetical protein
VRTVGELPLKKFCRPRSQTGPCGGFNGLRAGRLRPGGAIVPERIDGRFGLETTHAEGADAPPGTGRDIRAAETTGTTHFTQAGPLATRPKPPDMPKGSETRRGTP